jgi:hypothetical protein
VQDLSVANGNRIEFDARRPMSDKFFPGIPVIYNFVNTGSQQFLHMNFKNILYTLKPPIIFLNAEMPDFSASDIPIQKSSGLH